MSKFKVKLKNAVQGLLDIYNEDISIQRSIYVTGPLGKHRELKDGQIFTDSNYWKRYAYPQAKLEDAFIEVLEDDGSVYVDKTNNNAPRVYILSVEGEFENNVVDLGIGEFAEFVQISNRGSDTVDVRINSSDDAIFGLLGSETQVFNTGDLNIQKIEFSNDNQEAVPVQVIASVNVVSGS
jgi:hypothetical protein